MYLWSYSFVTHVQQPFEDSTTHFLIIENMYSLSEIELTLCLKNTLSSIMEIICQFKHSNMEVTCWQLVKSIFQMRKKIQKIYFYVLKYTIQPTITAYFPKQMDFNLQALQAIEKKWSRSCGIKNTVGGQQSEFKVNECVHH